MECKGPPEWKPNPCLGHYFAPLLELLNSYWLFKIMHISGISKQPNKIYLLHDDTKFSVRDICD